MNALALSRDGSLRDLRHTGWGPNEGAPDAIQALAQTSDGYLWMGNAGGLFRFDGLRFERVDLPRDDRLSSVNVLTLFAPTSGGLWIGFNFGGAAFLKDGHVTPYGQPDGLPRGGVTAFVEDLDGAVWVSTPTGLARLEASRWKTVSEEYGFVGLNERLMVDSAGTIWAASRMRVLFLPRGGKRFQLAAVQPHTDTPGPRDDALGIAESASGRVWLFSDQQLQQLHKNDNPQRRTGSGGVALIADRDDSLWMIKADASIQRVAVPNAAVTGSLPAAGETPDFYTEKDGRTAGPGYGLIVEDREGNVWVSSQVGLDRFSERRVSRLLPVLDPRIAFSPAETALAAGDAGRLWIGGRLFPLLSMSERKVERAEPVGNVTSAIRTREGTVWFGDKTGLWRHRSGRFDRVPLPEADGGDVQAIAADGAGGLWVSVVGKGVYRLLGGAWTKYDGGASRPRIVAVSMATDAKGRVWFGYAEGRMSMFDGTTFTMFDDELRLPVGTVLAIHARGERIWAGGDFGLALFDGTRFRSVTAENGASFKNITGIVETAVGDLWLNTVAGIVHIEAEETSRVVQDAAHNVHAEIFDAFDGVQGSPARIRPLPTAIEGTDGRVWFSTSIGLYSIDPAHIHRNRTAPPVLIQAVATDDKTYLARPGLTLPVGTRSLRIDYVGLNLTMAEKIRYRYKLDAVDGDWQEAQGRRQAFYTNLVPGAHRFRVIAANNDGVWNDNGATLDFVIPPTFVQTGWFVALCVLVSLTVVFLLIRLRYRRMALRLRLRFEERMAERERIARELHDTLLQSTQGLILKVQGAVNHLPIAEPARAVLEEALKRADTVMAEGRDRIQELRRPADAGADLATSLANVGQELSKDTPISFRITTEGAARDLQASVADPAYQLGREALLNAFRHAQASSVEVQIIYGDGAFRLRIRDDGSGIDSSALEANRQRGHWGIQGMRERAENVGGKMELWSAPGAGTEIELSVPAAKAYKAKVNTSRWPMWRVARRPW